MAKFPVLFAAVGLLGVAGCGGGDDRGEATQATSPPLGRAPSATAPPAGGAPSTTSPAPREAPGGSQRVRVPATFTLRAGALTPRSVSVPPFLAVEISVAATDGRAHEVTIAADRVYRLRVPAGKRGSILLPGQRAGRYALTAEGARATLVVGGEPGP